MSSRPSRGAARLAAILDALPDALLLVNRNGTVVNANAMALETLEAPGTPIVGRGLLDLLPNFDRSRIPGSVRATHSLGQRAKPTRTTARRTDGKTLPVEVTSANLSGGYDDELLMIVVRDLTGSLDIEAELSRQQRQTEMILRAASEGIVGIDSDGAIVLANPAAARILRHRASDLGGRLLHELIQHSRADGTPLPGGECPVLQTLGDGRRQRLHDQTLWRGDGTSVVVDMTTAPVRLGESVVGAVMTFTDSSRERTLSAHRDQLTELVESELCSRLEGARGRLRALSEGGVGELAPAARRVVRQVSGELEDLGELAGDVLRHQRGDDVTPEPERAPTTLDDLVDRALETVTQVARARGVEFTVNAAPVGVRVDVDAMTRALGHLLADTVVPAPARSTVVVTVLQRGPNARVEVRGPVSKGSSVHVPLARAVVEAHGGTLTVRRGGLPQRGRAAGSDENTSVVDESPTKAGADRARATPPEGQDTPAGESGAAASTYVVELPADEKAVQEARPAPSDEDADDVRRRGHKRARALTAGRPVTQGPQKRPADRAASDDASTDTGAHAAQGRVPDGAGEAEHGATDVSGSGSGVVSTPYGADTARPFETPGASQVPSARPSEGGTPGALALPAARSTDQAAVAIPGEPDAPGAPGGADIGRQSAAARLRPVTGPGTAPVPPAPPVPTQARPQDVSRAGERADSPPQLESAAPNPFALPAGGASAADEVPLVPAAPAGRHGHRGRAEDGHVEDGPPQHDVAPALPDSPPSYEASGRHAAVGDSGVHHAAVGDQAHAAAGARSTDRPRTNGHHTRHGAGARRPLATPQAPIPAQTRPGEVGGRATSVRERPRDGAGDTGGMPAHPLPGGLPAADGVPQDAPGHGRRRRPEDTGQHQAFAADEGGPASGGFVVPGPSAPMPVDVGQQPGVHLVEPEMDTPPPGAVGAVPGGDWSTMVAPTADGQPRRLLVWPEPDQVTAGALVGRGWNPVLVRSREEVEANAPEHPAALFVDPLTGPITRTALQSLRTAATASSIPVLVTAGLMQATRDAAFGADPAVLLRSLAPVDSAGHAARVLLVEANADIAAAFTGSLERRGMDVVHAASESEAVSKASSVEPNLVVLDLMLVRRRRVGVVDWLRNNQRLHTTPIVVYTTVDLLPEHLPRLQTGETVLYLAERSTRADVQQRVVDLLGKIASGR